MSDFFPTFARRNPVLSAFLAVIGSAVIIEATLRAVPESGAAAFATFMTVLMLACFSLPLLATRD